MLETWRSVLFYCPFCVAISEEKNHDKFVQEVPPSVSIFKGNYFRQLSRQHLGVKRLLTFGSVTILKAVKELSCMVAGGGRIATLNLVIKTCWLWHCTVIQ